MAEALARAAYSLLLWLAQPLYFARLAWRGRREPGYRQRWRQRLGWAPAEPGAAAVARPRIWLHAVSLGETRAAEPLIAALRERLPGHALLLTCSTATGAAAAQALLRPERGDVQAWLPYDTPCATRRFLRHARPRVGVLMETEVWPNLLHAAGRAGVPMVLANARLSARSQRKGERLGLLMRAALARMGAVLAQTDADARRFAALGAPAVEVCGNLKFDIEPSVALRRQGTAWRAALARPVVLAASTREGEEAALLAAWARRAGADAPARALLLLVPRHPQRFDEVASLVERAGLALARRSSWGQAAPAPALGADVWLGDSMGEMALYAACADAALLGGSFAPLGGQNLIELAACGCPVVLGPHTFNFAEAAELALAAGAAVRVADLDAGVDLALEWVLAGDAGRSLRRERAFAFAAAHRGATTRMADRIVQQLRAPPG